MSKDFQFDVFLTHSAKDKPVVRDVAERLKKDGVRVWFNEWEIKPGDSIPAKIEEGLLTSTLEIRHSDFLGSAFQQMRSAGTGRNLNPHVPVLESAESGPPFE